MSTCRGMKMYRQTKQRNEKRCEKKVSNTNELPPKNTVWDARVKDEEKISIDSITAKTDILKMTRPGIIQDDIPIYFNGHYFELMSSSEEGNDVVLGNVYNAENINYEKSADDKLLFFTSDTVRVVDAFTNFGCLFLHKESNDSKLNYTILCKSEESNQEGAIKFGKQNIYVYCDAINEQETNGETTYTPINPRKIRAQECDVSKVTFYFFTITKIEKTGNTEVVVLNEPYHFVPGTSTEDKQYGKGELVEGAPEGGDGGDSEDGGDSDDEDGDIFVPVYPEGTVDSEGNDISGEPVTNSDGTVVQLLENQETMTGPIAERLSDVEMEIDGETVHVDLRGAFPVTKFVGSNEDIQYEDDNKTPLTTKYVFVYYQKQELLKDGEEDGENLNENIKINFLIGNHFTVEKDEALMLYRRIELYDKDESEINVIMNKVEIEHYPCNVLYYNKNTDKVSTINEYKIMEYQGLYVLGTAQINVEYVNGNFHLYEVGKLSCYAPVDSQKKRFRLLDLVVSDKASLIYKQSNLKCKDVYQEEILAEQDEVE